MKDQKKCILMMTLEQMIEQLKNELDGERFLHSVNVMKTSMALADHYKADCEKAALAGILHDCGKNYKGERAREFIKEMSYQADDIEWMQTRLLHGVIGEYLAQTQYGITDEEILGAIRWHTTGRAGMTLLEKIVYVADYIEPLRSFQGVEAMRAAAYEDLDKCVVLCADSTISYVIKQGALLHPRTIETRNYSLLLLKSRNAG